MTIIELLQKIFNATEEQTNSFTEGMKANKIFTTSEENMDIRYGKLNEKHTATTKQLEDANALIEDLRKNNKGNEDLQQKVTAYEAENEKLKAQLLKVEIAAEAQVELLAAGAKPDDLDYIMFKMEADSPLEKGEDGKIKGLADKIAAIKTQRPDSFNSDGKKVYMENKLPEKDGRNDGITKEDFNKMSYQERLKVFQEQPESYAELTKN